MSNALIRGRVLNPEKVEQAKQWRENHIKELCDKANNGTATLKERRELRWKWGVELDNLGG